MKQPVLFLVGPTASGKSQLAILLAKQLNGEIISADSMQIYKQMDIGTAKPTLSERRKARHYLVDVIPPSKNFSAFDFRKHALEIIRKIVKKKKLPIVAGGTGFYVRALLQGLPPETKAKPSIRKKLHQEAAKNGTASLYEKLLEIDPIRASHIRPEDEKRIIRALEIYQSTGKKPSQLTTQGEKLLDMGFEPVVIGILKNRNRLYRDIETRVDQMFRKGFIQEVKRLSKKKISNTADCALGYRQVRECIHGTLTVDDAKAEIKMKTRQFAKRQITWFKKEQGIEWILWEDQDSVRDICRKILNRLPSAMVPDFKYAQR